MAHSTLSPRSRATLKLYSRHCGGLGKEIKEMIYPQGSKYKYHKNQVFFKNKNVALKANSIIDLCHSNCVEEKRDLRNCLR